MSSLCFTLFCVLTTLRYIHPHPQILEKQLDVPKIEQNSIDNNNNLLLASSGNETNMSCKPCKCGIANKATRIIGGKPTEKYEYPWMVQLLKNKNGHCGASLINNLYVLTAAHCTVDGKENYTVRFMEHDRTNDTTSSREPHHFDIKVKQIIRGEFNDKTLVNDIALFELETPVSFTHKVNPICLPPEGKTFAGEIGIAIGWGKVGPNTPGNLILQEVEVPIITNEECKQRMKGLTPNMICTHDKEENKGVCFGDSGGPLQVVIDKKSNTHHLAGIASFTWSSCTGESVYTRVNNYLKWITDNTKNGCYCT